MVEKCASGAGNVAANYSKNGYSDWFLPSTAELVYLNSQKIAVGLPNDGIYWGSNETSTIIAAALVISGEEVGDLNKSHLTTLWPIRAFSPGDPLPAPQLAITRTSFGSERRTAFITQPQITIQDASSNKNASSSAVVTATISAGGTLVGATTATAFSGVATFSNLGIDGTVGTTYTITYSSHGLTPATASVTLAGTACDGATFNCQVGDIGPGSGKIFYVAAETFSCGQTLTSTCQYLEAAPTTGAGAWNDATYPWSENTDTASGATSTAIGTGYSNTLKMVRQVGAGTTGAGSVSRNYRGGGKNDWYLPSKDELHQLYLNQTVAGAIGGYWSSSEYNATSAWDQGFWNGTQGAGGKQQTTPVRPIRAFGSTPSESAIIYVPAIAGVAAPVWGATPATTVTAANGYTGTVSWSGSPSTFAVGTAYTATITLTATSGFTLTGVPANFFTVANTSSPATNPIDSGVITAVFPATSSSSRQVTCGAGTYTVTDGVASDGGTCTGSLVIDSDVREIATEAFRGAAITSLTLPANLQTIRYAAFYETNRYPSLTIPDSVTLIESQAFEQGRFTTLTLGNGLTSIGDQVFYRNYGDRINSVTFGTGLTSIGAAAFQDFGVKKLILPEGLTTLSSRAFDGTSTTILSLPNSLTTIEADAFVNASLRVVKYCGTSNSVTNFNFGFGGSVCGAIVEFNPNLGSGSMDPIISSRDSALPANTFTRSRYTFQGWNTLADGLGTAYAPNAIFPFSTPTDKTLYAVWLADLAAPAFTLSAASGSAITGSAITSYTISSTGGEIASYSISPAISNGTLTFNTSTGLLSGIPNVAAPATVYTITAQNATSPVATRSYTLTINAVPIPVPYLKALTTPQLRLSSGKLLCTPGTYNAGFTIDGVVDESTTTLFTPSSFTYNLYINGVAQPSLAVASSNSSHLWNMPAATSNSVITCSTTVSAIGVTNTSYSSENTSGVSTALSIQTTAITNANKDYSAALNVNLEAYQKALVDNRATWRSNVEANRSTYSAELSRIGTLTASKTTRALRSAALKNYITSQKKISADYAASKPSALSAMDAANKTALASRDAATAEANLAYGTFIESIGYGVLIP
jgi:hypothetical protein